KYSVFSVSAMRHRLANTRVFVRYPNESVFCSDLYRNLVERFWSLYITYQEGTLAAFAACGENTLEGVFDSGAPAIRTDGIDPNQNKVEMISMRREVPHRTIECPVAEVSFVEVPAPQPPPPPAAPALTAAARAEAPILAQLSRIPASQTALGIMWDIEGMDL